MLLSDAIRNRIEFYLNKNNMTIKEFFSDNMFDETEQD